MSFYQLHLLAQAQPPMSRNGLKTGITSLVDNCNPKFDNWNSLVDYCNSKVEYCNQNIQTSISPVLGSFFWLSSSRIQFKLCLWSSSWSSSSLLVCQPLSASCAQVTMKTLFLTFSSTNVENDSSSADHDYKPEQLQTSTTFIERLLKKPKSVLVSSYFLLLLSYAFYCLL